MDFPTAAQFFYLSPQGKIHYRHLERSGAPLIVILPGFTMPSSLYWRLATELHSDGSAVIIVDYWGRGFSETRSDRNYTLESHISLVVSLLGHLQVAKCSFIGVSYGAAVLAGLSAKLPEIVDKMVFVSPLHFTNESPTSLQKFALGTPVLGPMLLRFTAPKMVPQQIQGQVVDSPELVAKVASLCLQQFRGGWSNVDAISRAIAAFDVCDVEQAFAGLANVNKKMLVLIGEQDSLVDLNECKAWWSRWIQNANLEVIENAGHLVFLEKEKEVMTHLKGFFTP